MDILRPKYEQVAEVTDPEEKSRRLEQLAVVASIENLMTFPFVEKRVNDGSLSLHGLWTDIAEGTLCQFSGATNEFQPV